jgi:endoglucanase
MAALDFYSIPGTGMVARLNDPNPVASAIANGIHTGWIGDWTVNPQSVVSGWVSSSGGKAFAVVIYGIPGRDAGGYSGGGFADRTAYLSWITSLKNGSGTHPVWWILEPDAVGHSRSFDATTRAERLETLRQAVVILRGNTNARVYIDASQWVPADEMAGLLQTAGMTSAHGFSCNVSNFVAQSTINSWATAVLTGLNNRGLTGKKFVVDTSRNGNGVLPTTYPGSSIWHTTGQTWCNPPGRGVGLSPRVPGTALPACDAYLWIKMLGESDGQFPTAAEQDVFNTNAPIAGTFWPEWWDDFVAHSNAANLSLARVQVARTAATTPAVAAGAQVQVARTTATTLTSVVTPAPRISGTNLTRPVPTEAYDEVSMTLTITGTFTSTTWTQLDTGAPDVTLSGSDVSKVFVTPAVLDGGRVQFSVTATGPGGTSAPVVFTVDFETHNSYFHDGLNWAPTVKSVAL